MSGTASARRAYDAIVIGGGPAGLSAALVLGRARRRTLVIDEGHPRNAPAPAAHGMLTRDGTAPGSLLQKARDELGSYPSVTLVQDQAQGACQEAEGFTVQTAGGASHRSRRLLLTHGVRDVLPPIEGLAALWGTAVLHCGYCHGWEVRDEPLALYAPSAEAMAAAATLLSWSRDLVLCTDGAEWPDASHRTLLVANGIRLLQAPLQRVEAEGTGLKLVLAGGATLYRRALFLSPPQALDRRIADDLGCRFASPARLAVGADGATSVLGVYAAGDLAAAGGQIVTAAASGATAAMALHADLAREEFLAATPQAADAALPRACSS